MPWSGIGSGAGASSASHASVQRVLIWRAGFPVIERERTVSEKPAARRFSTTHGAVADSATISQMDPVQRP